MGRLLSFLVALIAVAIAVLLFAPGIIPAETYKGRIETAASNALGREVTIGDNLSFRIIPQTAFHVEDLSIANADGFDGETLARVGEADIGVKLFPLLSGSVEVDRFVLTEPDINLIRSRDGKVNWNLASTDTAAAQEDASTNGNGRSVREVSLGDVRIVDGRARYEDKVAGKTYTADDIDLKVLLQSLNEPLEADGTMMFQGAPTKIDMVLTSLADVMANEPTNLKLDMTIGEATVGADLTIETAEALRYSGPIDLNAPDLPAFAALVGTQLADAPGFDRLALAGDVEGGATALRLSNANIGFDEIDAQGVLTLAWNGARPKAGGVLSTDKLDLRPYMPPPVEGAEGFPEWSTVNMDFTSLRNIDADFDISTNSVFLNDLEIGESRLLVKIAAGRMTADIPELAMYGGQGSGRLVVNARGATPSFAGNFDMDAVNAQPFSMDLLKHDNLLGLGSFKFDFNASGANQAAIMSSLDGEGGFDLANGALKGVNIAKIIRAVGAFQEGFNPAALTTAVAAARGPNEETDFSEFLSNFKIDNGLLNVPAITLNGPYLTMSGNGAINLPQQTIDLRLAPRGSTTLDGDGGRKITVPVRIGGTFSKPTIGVDAEALLQSGVQNQLFGILDGLTKSKKEPAATQDNAQGDETTPPEEPAKEPSPEEAVLGIFESILGGAAPEEEEKSGDE